MKVKSREDLQRPDPDAEMPSSGGVTQQEKVTDLAAAYHNHVKTCVFKLRTLPLSRAAFAYIFGEDRWHRVQSEGRDGGVTYDVNLLSGETLLHCRD